MAVYVVERTFEGGQQEVDAATVRWALLQGQWDVAAETARTLLARPGLRASARIALLATIGVLRARRRDPHPWAPLDEALAIALRSPEWDLLGPVAVARAEARWLTGRPALVSVETDRALAAAGPDEASWTLGELLVWRKRAGLDFDIRPELPAPVRAELEGDARGAARMWGELGCAYEAGLSLAGSDDLDDLRRSLATVQALGARAASEAIARRLRERGALNFRRGPLARTQANPAGLTARQLEVLELLVEGESNAAIAARLFLSVKTVGHHVSAILRKLDAGNRGQAAAAGARLGIGR